MSNSVKETYFYEDVSSRLVRYLSEVFDENCKIFAAHNQMAGGADMSGLVDLIVAHFGIEKRDTYVPRIKIDLLIGILDQSGNLRLLIVEVKYGSPLKLIDYSQLTGYMHVARTVPCGILILVNSSISADVSTDFIRDVHSGQLLMSWNLVVPVLSIDVGQSTAIAVYTVGNGVDFIDTSSARGISRWGDLRDFILASTLILN